MRIEPASPSDLPAIRGLLESVKLPADDLDGARQRFLVVRDGAGVVGCVALEPYGPLALLRSLAVRPDHQRTGLGLALHRQALSLAVESGVDELYLLTTTARDFFAAQGWGLADRAAAPAPLQASAQFTSCCPSSATCMTLHLAAPPAHPAGP